MNLYLTKEILENKTLSDEAVCVWAALRQEVIETKKKYLINTEQVGYLLYDREVNRYELDSVKKGINELLSNDLISITGSRKVSVMDLSKLYFKQGSAQFSNVNSEELHSIMNLPTRHDKFKLFRYYSCLIGSFNNSPMITEKYKGKVGGFAVKYLCTLCDISTSSLLEYNKILEKNNLLFIHRFGDYIVSTKNHDITMINHIRTIPNCYSRYSDREICLEFSKAYEESFGYSGAKAVSCSKKSDANIYRSLAQKYNAMVNGKEYDLETQAEIKAYCIKFNQAEQKRIEREIKLGNKPVAKFKDLSVFKK